MKKFRKYLALALSLAILISLAACAPGGNEKYNVVAKLQTQQLCVAFRKDDKAGDTVIAALAALQADGTVARISRDWFHDSVSMLKGDETALDGLDIEQGRSFLVGYDAAHLPFSGEDADGNPIGFDVDLARAVCEKLGWKVKFLPINVADAQVELKSGNVDCVWGGYAFVEGKSGLNCSPAYMKNTVVVAALRGSGVRGEKSLAGKTLAVSETGQFAAALNQKPKVAAASEYLIRLPGGSDDCFKALEDGVCDAIVTDLAAIAYHR